MKRKRQFIAGAVCPQCSSLDTLVLYGDDQSIVCVDCDFHKSSEQRDLKHSTKKNINQIKITNLDD